jgi:hypothetical protein
MGQAMPLPLARSCEQKIPASGAFLAACGKNQATGAGSVRREREKRADSAYLVSAEAGVLGSTQAGGSPY